MQKVRWGILSTAKIGLLKVIPAMREAKLCEIVGIASRHPDKARAAAAELGILRAYGTYEELLADREIDAIYNPLPNHMHVAWSIKAMEAGKHVLCEKPIGMNAGEAETLLQAARRHPRLKVMEAFMYRHHSQWQFVLKLLNEGQIGELRTVQLFFSYCNSDPNNIRNIAEAGGGGLMDIGCYCVSVSRYLFNEFPQRVVALSDYDPAFNTDRMTSAMLEFSQGTSTFTCATQLAPYQRALIFGNQGRIEVEIPFNAPPDKPCKLWLQRGAEMQELTTPVCNQYTNQVDLFCEAVLEDKPVYTPLEDAVANMRVIDAIVASAESRTWLAC